MVLNKTMGYWEISRALDSVIGPEFNTEWVQSAAYAMQKHVIENFRRISVPHFHLWYDPKGYPPAYIRAIYLFEWMSDLPALIQAAPMTDNVLVSKDYLAMMTDGNLAGNIFWITGTLPYEGEVYARPLPFSHKANFPGFLFDLTPKIESVQDIVAVKPGSTDEILVGEQVWVRDYEPDQLESATSDVKQNFANYYRSAEAKKTFRFYFLGDSHGEYGEINPAIAVHSCQNPFFGREYVIDTNWFHSEYRDIERRPDAYQPLVVPECALPFRDILEDRKLMSPLTQIIEQECLSRKHGKAGMEDSRFQKLAALAGYCGKKSNECPIPLVRRRFGLEGGPYA